MPTYINPNKHAIYLTNADGKVIKIDGEKEIVLPEYFDRYCDRRGFLRKVTKTTKTTIAKRPATSFTQKRRNQPPLPPPSLVVPKLETRTIVPRRELPPPTPQRPQQTLKPQNQPPSQPPPPRHKIVGRVLPDDANELLLANVNACGYPISNNIGVGILSYNRLSSLVRLIDSIRTNTDLMKTTVFISDDGSTDGNLLNYLNRLAATNDFVVLSNQQRLGVAGNSNRLLRCLSRFKHGLLLNDDVQVLAHGWDTFYAAASTRTGLDHFCMRQPGVYGAEVGAPSVYNGVAVSVTPDKPQGAVLSFTSNLLSKIGYFDENFGVYGMEHVDWSTRAQIQGQGFYDVAGSDKYFRIYADNSAVEDRATKLADGRRILASLPERSYVAPFECSSVPSISYVVPYRDFERSAAIVTVIANIRAQRFPDIDIVLPEHDTAIRTIDDLQPVNHQLVPATTNELFNKAKTFNVGVAKTRTGLLILHDADMLVTADYTQAIANALTKFDGCHLGKSVIYTTRDGCTTIAATGVVDGNIKCDRIIGYFEGGSLACKKSTYWLVGGFNEDFKGYGMEDCDFFTRLSTSCNWSDNRVFDFLHLWHSRVDGWRMHHDANKDLGRRLSARSMMERIDSQHAQLIANGYGQLLIAAKNGEL